MEESRVVPKERGELLAKEHNMPFFEVSTVTNTNIEEAFETVVRLILPRLMTPNVETINKVNLSCSIIIYKCLVFATLRKG